MTTETSTDTTTAQKGSLWESSNANGKTETPGQSLFRDIFARCDVNDDQSISKNEFISFFNDNSLNEAHLKSLFDYIDTDDSNDIDTSELLAFFLKGFSSVEQMFSGIDVLNKGLHSALTDASKTYATSHQRDQFRFRVFLREAIHLLESVSNVLSESLDQLVAVSAKQMVQQGISPESLTASAAHSEEKSRQISFNPSNVKNSVLGKQLDRFEALLESWKNVSQEIGGSSFSQGTPLRALLHEEIHSDDDDAEDEFFLLVSRHIYIQHDAIPSFRNAFKQFQAACIKDEDSFHIELKSFVDNPGKFVLYEIWRSSDDLETHYSLAEFRKKFEKVIIDSQDFPGTMKKMVVPSSWFPSLSSTPGGSASQLAE